MIDVNIHDGTTGQYRAEVRSDSALKVATTNYDTFTSQVRFFENSTYGIELNKNWSNDAAGNSNETIHNGTDTVAWTGSVISGLGWNLAATNNPDTGTKNVEQTGALTGDTIQFDRGSDVTMVNHTGFQGRLYITTTGHSQAELNMYAWDTGTGTQVGTSVDIYNYVNTSALSTYQTFVISLADMTLVGETFDAIRIEIATKAGGVFDLDNIVLTDPTGSSAEGPQEFTIAPSRGNRLLVNGFNLVFSDTYAGTVADGTMPSVPFDGFLGVSTLPSGMLFQVKDNDVTSFVGLFTFFGEFFNFGLTSYESGSDGTVTWVRLHINIPSPIVLNPNEKDKITLNLSDDLSGLDFFRWSAICNIQNLF